jgi:hypothetical protein
MYVLYYASMLQCWHLVCILVTTDHPCLGVGCHSVSPYRTIGTASSKPCLEATRPEFTSPGTRILTFLPWRRCIIAKSKLQKVNPC